MTPTDARRGAQQPPLTPGEQPPGAGPPIVLPGEGAEADPSELSFEDAFRALSEVVAALESGGLPIEASLVLYERGVALAARCTGVLEAAEQRVRQIDGEGRDAGPVAL